MDRHHNGDRDDDRAPRSTVTPPELPAPLQDGYWIHTAALARNCDVLLLPRQVLLAGGRGDRPGVLSFVQGVPNSTTLSAVSFAQDKRVRRSLLMRAGLPIPAGATFSFRGVNDARRYVRQLGFPIALKEAVGENPSRIVAVVSDEASLADAISRLRLLPNETSSSATSITRSAYSLTKLLEQEEDEEGQTLAAERTRYLAEKFFLGECLRVLILGREVLAVLFRPTKTLADEEHVPWQPPPGDVHDGFVQLAMQAAEVIPGLATTTVDIMMDDCRHAPAEQGHSIVEVSERPHLEHFVAALPGIGGALADAMMMAEMRRVGMAPPPIAETCAVRFGAEGLPDPLAIMPPLARICGDLGIEGWAGVRDVLDGTIEGVLEGTPELIAWVSEGLLSGEIDNQRAMVVEEAQCDPQGFRSFSDRGLLEAS